VYFVLLRKLSQIINVRYKKKIEQDF
jgi:hypothetical protein